MIIFFLFALMVTSLGSMFFFLNKRVEQLIDKYTSLVKATDILNDNQKVLEKDLKRLFHEFQNSKKEINQSRR